MTETAPLFPKGEERSDQRELALVINQDSKSPHKTPETPKTPKTFLSTVFNSEFFSSEDWWSCYIGFVLFAAIIPITILAKKEFHMPMFKTWEMFRFWECYTDFLLQKLVIFQHAACLLVFIAFKVMKKPGIDAKFYAGFAFVFATSVIAQIMGSQHVLKMIGLGGSVWAILLGVFLSNCIFVMEEKLPSWLQPVVVTEFYIKISVVLLAVDFSLFGRIGVQGFITTWIDTPIVLLIVFLVGWLLFKLPKEDSMVLAGGLSICGSSAATAITSSINGNKQVSALVITIMSFFTIPLIPLMPVLCNAVGMPLKIAGAWIGGSVDSTGAVVATASSLMEDAEQTGLKTAVVVKMMQNLLIGPVCLILTVIWTKKFSPKVLYERFPKFVIGFLVLSTLISLAVPYEHRNISQKNVFLISEWFSSFGFVCIGLELKISKMLKEFKANGLKLLIVYLLGQSMDILTTLGYAYLCFTFIKI